ncbi:enolase [Streptococcus pneumoniae]|nr:enolase [Streptococcus pneumoniae]
MAFSQRTAETENNIISHLAMSVTSSYLKAGGLDRLDRIAKYNEVLRNG